MVAVRFFPGWIVVGAAFLAVFVAFGSMYAFAAFFHELEREFAASRADISLIFSLSGFLGFTVGAVTGSLADRIGARAIVSAGAVLLAAGLFLASRADTLSGVYATYGLGVGFMYVPAVGAVQRWFDRYRGLASGIAVAGIGAGTLVVPLLATWLIEQGGWRNAYAVIAAGALGLGLIAAVLLDHSPERRGLHRDGIAPAGAPRTQPAPAGFTVTQALRSRPFWLLYAAGAMSAFGLFIPFVHLVPYALDRGFSESFGAGLIGLIGVGSVVGRFAFGGAADRIGRRVGIGIMFAGMAAMLFIWLGAGGPVMLIVFAFLFGAFYGGFVALSPALVADYYGGRHVSGIIGFLYTSAGIGLLFGPTLAGLAFDLSGSYVLPIAAGAVANLAAVACIVLIAEPGRFRAAAAGMRA